MVAGTKTEPDRYHELLKKRKENYDYATQFDVYYNMDETLMGRQRTFYHDSGWTLDNLQLIAAENRWGEGDSTAAGRIYITRLVTCASNEAYLQIPNADYQVVGVALEEDDLDYIMRLRRDYELAS